MAGTGRSLTPPIWSRPRCASQGLRAMPFAGHQAGGAGRPLGVRLSPRAPVRRSPCEGRSRRGDPVSARQAVGHVRADAREPLLPGEWGRAGVYLLPRPAPASRLLENGSSIIEPAAWNVMPSMAALCLATSDWSSGPTTTASACHMPSIARRGCRSHGHHAPHHPEEESEAALSAPGCRYTAATLSREQNTSAGSFRLTTWVTAAGDQGAVRSRGASEVTRASML